MNYQNVIAIDGPSGSGKSTTANALTELLPLKYLNTGAMYRMIALAVTNSSLSFEDHDKIETLLEETDIYIEDNDYYLNKVLVNTEIRSDASSQGASKVAAIPSVRKYLVAQQQKWIEENDGGILEGRDITSVVAPNALVKIYLTANSDDRATRRAAESDSNVAQITKELKERDSRDMNRENDPLIKTSDAIEIDTSSLSPTEVVDQIVKLYSERLTLLVTQDE